MRKTRKCGLGQCGRIAAMLLLTIPCCVLAIQMTTVQGVVYRGDGRAAQGTILISWPAFTAADGSTIAAGSTSTTIAADGTVNLSLVPNAGANPAGTYYTIVYHMSDGTVQREYWVVPQAAAVTVSEMRATVVPAAVAQQSVSQAYVDAAIGALPASYLQLRGGTMSGALTLSADPTSALQAATKEYVDAHAGGAQLPQAQAVLAGSGNGGAVSLTEEGVAVSGSSGSVAWRDDLNAGIYDARDPRWAGGIDGPTPGAALQAMSNQMACDMVTGKIAGAETTLPPGTYTVSNLQIAPGSVWRGAPHSQGGTILQNQVANMPAISAPSSMNVTCNGTAYTLSNGGTLISHLGLRGLGPNGGPGDIGLVMGALASTAEYIDVEGFGGPGIQVTGQDDKAYHLSGGSGGTNLCWYIWGNYKGYGEGLPSPEAHVTTTGATGSVSLTWTAVTNAAAYAVYRGTTAGGENAFYITTTNSFTDTGAAANTGNATPNTYDSSGGLSAPGTVTPTASTSGGTLAAGTYYYVVTPLATDGWHGSFELYGLDMMADWVEAYGVMDLPNAFNYHHMADILLGGGQSHFDHLWPQFGSVGIYVPYQSNGERINNFRVDAARLEGIISRDWNVSFTHGEIEGACLASNAQGLAASGEMGYNQLLGKCNAVFVDGAGSYMDDVHFIYPGIFGPAYNTSDYFFINGNLGQVYGATPASGYSWVGVADGFKEVVTNTTVNPLSSGGSPWIHGLSRFSFGDTTPASYWSVQGASRGAILYFQGGNSNATLVAGNDIETCSGQNINMGNVSGFISFVVTNGTDGFGPTNIIQQICDIPTMSASSETVAYSATPNFSASVQTSQMTLTGNVTSFTLAAGLDGEQKTLLFCQDATGGRTVAAPANVRGFFIVGATASKCSAQRFTYSAALSAWMADSPGISDE